MFLKISYDKKHYWRFYCIIEEISAALVRKGFFFQKHLKMSGIVARF